MNALRELVLIAPSHELSDMYVYVELLAQFGKWFTSLDPESGINKAADILGIDVNELKELFVKEVRKELKTHDREC